MTVMLDPAGVPLACVQRLLSGLPDFDTEQRSAIHIAVPAIEQNAVAQHTIGTAANPMEFTQ